MTLKELLNKLIRKGRVPFGDEKIHSFEIIYVTWKIKNIVAKRWRWQVNKHYSIIELCSKSSWLWQYVCENALYSYTNCVWKGCEWPVVADYIEPQSYKYRLIESALKDESELEEFLLQSIVINNE